MLPLDSPRWAELKHAYGNAADIPARLRQLESFPLCEVYTDEPWYSLWSALAHQSDVYSASFAAVPHVVRMLATDPTKADSSFFQFPAWVEICRQKNSVPIPPDLEEDYFAALKQLPSLVAAASNCEWDEDFLRCALSAIAASKGQTTIAEAILELSPDVARQFVEWLENQ